MNRKDRRMLDELDAALRRAREERCSPAERLRDAEAELSDEERREYRRQLSAFAMSGEDFDEETMRRYPILARVLRQAVPD